MTLLKEVRQNYHSGLEGVTEDGVTILLSAPSSKLIIDDPVANEHFKSPAETFMRLAREHPFHFYEQGEAQMASRGKAVALSYNRYVERGVEDPQRGAYAQWLREKEHLLEVIKEGPIAVFDYVTACVFGGTIETSFSLDEIPEAVREYILGERVKVLQASGRDSWILARRWVTAKGPQNERQDFWPHFKYLKENVQKNG